MAQVPLRFSTDLITVDIPDFAALLQSRCLGMIGHDLALYYCSIETDEAKKQAVLSVIDPSLQNAISDLGSMVKQFQVANESTTEESSVPQVALPQLTLPSNIGETFLRLVDGLKDALVTKDGQTTLDIFGMAQKLRQNVNAKVDQSKE